MKKKNLLWMLFVTVAIASSIMSLNTTSADPASPRIYIYDPETQSNVGSAPPGQTFTIEITLEKVTELIAFEYYLNWNTSLLDFVSMAEGPFLNSSGAYRSYLVTRNGEPPWNYTGKIYMAATLLGPTRKTSATGSGILAFVTFRAKAEGVCTLDLYDIILVNFDLKEIPHTIEDGSFAYPLPKVIVEPAEIYGQNIQNFDVNITIVDVENLYNWTLKLKWTPTLLNATNVAEGPFLKGGGTTDFRGQVYETAGFLYINNTLTAEPLGIVSGSGTLATITFNIETQGTSSLDVYDVKLFSKDKALIPNAIEDGFFSNLVRDVAITSVAVSSTTVKKGESLNITVVAENQGLVNETFTVAVLYDDLSAGSPQSVNNLPPTGSRTLTFIWDTKDVAPGSYIIKASASQVPGEADTTDNTRTASESVTVTGEESGFPIALLIGGAAVAVIVVIALLLYRRSKSPH